MSLILEALRRSEEERRRRSLSPLLSAPRQRRRSRRLLPALVAAVALASIAIGALALRHALREPEPLAPPPSAAPAAPPPARPVPSVQGPEETSGGGRSALPAPPPIEALRPREDDPAALLRESPAILAPASPDPLADPALDPRARERLAEMLNPVPDAVAPAPSEPATAPTLHDGGSGSAPAYEELPYALRREMPAFRVSMIVAASDRAARFVLSDGQRRREGEELAPGIRIVEIAAEGLLLEFRGQRFRWRQTAR